MAEQLIRALNLCHLFGSLTLAGVKKIETPSWRPPKCVIGKRTVIYAARPTAHRPATRIPNTTTQLSAPSASIGQNAYPTAPSAPPPC